MELIADIPTIVLAGSWNNAIFNGEWVSRNLLPNTDLNIEFPLMSNASMRISTKELRIGAIENRLLLNAILTTDEVFGKIETLAVKIAEYLPHTPVTAFGYNFNYTLESPPIELQPLADRINYSIEGLTYEKSVLKTTFRKGEMLINIEFEPRVSNSEIRVNFHFNITSLTEFISIISKYPIKEMITYSATLIDHLNHQETTDVTG